ncbi:MAG TPA: penicillin-binding protein 2 [Patescibacteria group bacterium]|nr:penicillin-binding protein 2 [Patescibacteria group bacterium]
MYSHSSALARPRRAPKTDARILTAAGFLALGGFIILVRFFQLQILDHHTYSVLASDQHEIQASLVPKRGTIYLQDRLDGTLYPIAQDRDSWLVYASPKEIKDPNSIAPDLALLLNLPESELLPKISTTSSYAVLAKDVSLDTVQQIQGKRFPGIGISKDVARLYPEPGLGGQVIGFVSAEDKTQRIGRYGMEGADQDILAGEYGSLIAEKDAAGRRLTIGDLQLKAAHDGSDIVLTLDRAIQYEACAKIQDAVKQFEADSGTVLIMEPNTGAVLAMCSSPNFDPANYGKIQDVSVLNNPATFDQFEPGSVFKAFTMAIGLDLGKVNPKTTYHDTGEENIDGFKIHNSDKLGHGIQTMEEVLEKSLNTGTIFVERLIGANSFRDYVSRFGFGQKTGIGFQAEAKGNISSLSKPGAIWAATASYGQGISVSPIQLVAAYAALGNGGKLVKPYIVQSVIHPDGSREDMKPQTIGQIIDPRTSRLISAMLVNVVEKGHGKRAGVPGYYVAGKTGTAQVPNPNGKGYLANATIGSFAGYAPADNPKFVMLVKIDHPRAVDWAESSAAPTFGDLAKFLLNYLQVPPERPIKDQPLSASSTSTVPAVKP